MPEQAPDGSIIITPKEFYDGVRGDITEIKSSVSALREDLSALPARMDKAEGRIDRLENKLAWFCGGAAALGAVVGHFLPLVTR